MRCGLEKPIFPRVLGIALIGGLNVVAKGFFQDVVGLNSLLKMPGAFWAEASWDVGGFECVLGDCLGSAQYR